MVLLTVVQLANVKVVEMVDQWGCVLVVVLVVCSAVLMVDSLVAYSVAYSVALMVVLMACHSGRSSVRWVVL